MRIGGAGEDFALGSAASRAASRVTLEQTASWTRAGEHDLYYPPDEAGVGQNP